MREQRITAPTIEGLRNIRAILTAELERGRLTTGQSDALEAVEAEMAVLEAGE